MFEVHLNGASGDTIECGRDIHIGLELRSSELVDHSFSLFGHICKERGVQEWRVARQGGRGLFSGEPSWERVSEVLDSPAAGVRWLQNRAYARVDIRHF